MQSELNTPLVGRHYGPAGPALARTGLVALSEGASAIQVFAGAPLSYTASRPLSAPRRAAWLEASTGMARLVHGSYYLLLSEPAHSYKFALVLRGILDQMAFAAAIGASALVIHAGSAKAATAHEDALHMLRSVLAALDAEPIADVRLLLENGAGRTGFGVPVLLELLAELGDERLGLCLDTAHAYARGDSVVDMAAYGTELALAAVHLNAPNPTVTPGSGRDRHSVALLDGTLSLADVEHLVGALGHLPMIIEGTPKPEHDFALVRLIRTGVEVDAEAA